jgi:hypothetical protein
MSAVGCYFFEYWRDNVKVREKVVPVITETI